MGASGWDYVVAYQDDVAAALRELRARAFAEGDYYWPGEPSARPATPEQLWEDEAVQYSGTHSILDVDRVVAADEAGESGTVGVLDPDEFLAGSGIPYLTRAVFEQAQEGDGLLPERWSGYAVVLYSETGRPVEIAFWGLSGD